jgi:hypothetical protein
VPLPWERALRAIGATVAEARESVYVDPGSLPAQLVAVGELVGDAMAAVLGSGVERVSQCAVAGKLVTVMEAVSDALRALPAGDQTRSHVTDALTRMTAAVSDALKPAAR